MFDVRCVHPREVSEKGTGRVFRTQGKTDGAKLLGTFAGLQETAAGQWGRDPPRKDRKKRVLPRGQGTMWGEMDQN